MEGPGRPELFLRMLHRRTRRFPGTVSVPMAELERTATTILSGLSQMGARRILVVSGHAERGHMAALREAGDAAQSERRGLSVAVLSDYDFVYELRGQEAPKDDGHAGLLETSRLLALAPALVGPERPVGHRRRSPFRVGPPDGPAVGRERRRRHPGRLRGALGDGCRPTSTGGSTKRWPSSRSVNFRSVSPPGACELDPESAAPASTT